MNWLETRTFRTISGIVLIFWIWSFGGLVDIVAYAAKSDQQSAFSSQRSSASADQPRAGRPEGKLQKTIKDIVQIVQAVQAVQTVEEKNVEKNKLKTKKLEIEVIDVEIRTQFAETEEKIKDLPETIKQRHRDFVAKYEENLNELKANLEAIESLSAESIEFEEAVKKTKTFLDKVKPPKKHIPLDPNKLPHRTAEPTEKKPRTKKEEFGPQRAEYKEQTNPILVASNGPLAGLLDSSQYLGATEENFLISELPIPKRDVVPSGLYVLQSSDLPAPILLAAADPPMDADLAETIEVQFTPAIIAKATELENKPVFIYNWVRNNIEFVPTYGSIQGADYCLQTKLCNDFDTASLLIALLRVSGIHARYVEGTVEIPIEKVKNWVGGFTDDNSALSFIASGGIPVGGITSGGKIITAQMEHIWVEAWIDYIPSRGARHQQGDMWIPLDASFKQYNYTEGIDIQSEVPFDAQTFVDQIVNTATINEEEGYATGVDSLFIQQTMEDYQTQVENYITQNYPDATVGDVLGKKDIIQQEFSYLLGTSPYKTILKGDHYSEIPNGLRHELSFSVSLDNILYDTNPLTITKTLPELAGKKITLSYSPATQADEDVITSYLPEPHADGTPIDPSELPTSFPAYLINLKPELRIDGEVIAIGGSVMMGLTENFVMSFTYPGQSGKVVQNYIESGEYLGIALDLSRISLEQILAIKAKLDTTKTKLETKDFTELTKDDVLGNLLYTTALLYFAELDAMNYIQGKNYGVTISRLPSVNIFSFELNVITSFYDTPLSAGADGLAMDVDYNIHAVKALDGDVEKPKQFMLISGHNSSALEHSVPEELFSTPENPAESISAVKALQIANNQGIPIYTINQTNISTVLPQLQLDAGTVAHIQNAVNAGKEVTVSQSEIDFNGWIGAGYIIIDPLTGAGAYMISGGINGGWTVLLTAFKEYFTIVGLELWDNASYMFEFWKDFFEKYEYAGINRCIIFADIVLIAAIYYLARALGAGSATKLIIAAGPIFTAIIGVLQSVTININDEWCIIFKPDQ